MIRCRVEWMPKTNEGLSSLLDEMAPFMLASYDENQQGLHGELAFDLPLWLHMWDTRAAFFVTARDGERLVGVSMCIKFTPIWYNRVRVDIERIVADSTDIATGIEEYIVGIADVLEVDEIYRVKYAGTIEHKEAIYGVRRPEGSPE